MPFQKLLEGYKSFREIYSQTDNRLLEELAKRGQAPETLVIACSDSRSDPAIITSSQPGDLFVVRNVAAIVPPYKKDTLLHHGTSAAIEFAVKTLKVKHIIVMGHSGCGGIQALARRDIADDQYEFLGPWVKIGQPALEAVDKELPDATPENRQRVLEQAVTLVSLNNLMTFPWIAEPVRAKTLKLHGWYFDIGQGKLMTYDPEKENFSDL